MTLTQARAYQLYNDTETGYLYLRARYYDPTTAQFLTRDPSTHRRAAPTATAGTIR